MSNPSNREQLESELSRAFWSWLKPHFERGAVILVSPELVLVDAALSVAQDDVQTVQAWLSDGLLARPTPQQTESWDQNAGKEFLFLIVQPYVLIQDPQASH